MEITRYEGAYFDRLKEVELPFVLLPQYFEFIKSQGKDIYLIHREDSFAVLFVEYHKKFKLAKFAFVPLNFSGEALEENEEKLFLNGLVRQLKKCKVADRIGDTDHFVLFKSFPDGSTRAPFGSFQVQLAGRTSEELMASLNAKNRNKVKVAIKRGGLVKSGFDCLNDFYVAYQETMTRSDMFCEPKEFFVSLAEKLEDQYICSVVYNVDGVPQGGIFVPYTKFGAYYIWGATAEGMELAGAMNLVHWDLMEKLSLQGVGFYDFVGARLSDVSGSKLGSIQKFKSGFGTTLLRGYKWKIDIHRLNCEIYDRMIQLYWKVKGLKWKPDIIDEEAAKVV